MALDRCLLSTGASGDMLEDLDLNSIADERARELVRRLLNLLEAVIADLRAAQAENQRLRDEINRLKGEQCRPAIQPNTPPPLKDHASEQERRRPKTWSAGRKTERLSIDGNRWHRLIQTACHQMRSSKGMRT